MKRKSIMAPKRISPRPTLSRDDYQLDTRSHCISDGIKFSPVLCWEKDGRQKFRLKLDGEGDNIRDLSSLAEDLRNSGLNLSMNVVNSVIDALLEVIPKYMAKTGRAVRLGNLVMLKPYATGSLEEKNGTPDTKKNHVEIRATACPALRYSLSRAKLVNTVKKAEGIEMIVAENNGAKRDVVYVGENHFINGRNIYVPKSDSADAGSKGSIWLESAAGERIGHFEVSIAGDSMVGAKLVLEREPTSSDCVVVMDTFGTSEAAKKGEGMMLRRRYAVQLSAN